MPTFKSSICRGGSVLTPDIITVDDHYFQWRRRNDNLIRYNTLKIPKQEIRMVISNEIISTSMIFYHFGNVILVAENFAKRDAEAIQSLLLK